MTEWTRNLAPATATTIERFIPRDQSDTLEGKKQTWFTSKSSLLASGLHKNLKVKQIKDSKSQGRSSNQSLKVKLNNNDRYGRLILILGLQKRFE